MQRLLRWLFENYEQWLADLEEDKILSGLEHEQSSEIRTEKQDDADAEFKELRCSFCRKKKAEVQRIVSGPKVYICSECLEICNAILEDDKID